MTFEAEHSPTTSAKDSTGRAPRIALWLGFAGLLPQALALISILAGNPEGRFTALSMAYAYAALILSFLGGMWWGLAAQAGSRAPTWVWFAAVAPSLIALVSALPWATGEAWPGPSLTLLGIALLGSLGADRKLRSFGMCPGWWLWLRVPLSVGLGTMTLTIAWVS